MWLLARTPEPALATDEVDDPDDEPEEAADLVSAIRENQDGSLGDWHEVPPDVPRSLQATIVWGLSTMGDHR
jgi:hypothetical protein